MPRRPAPPADRDAENEMQISLRLPSSLLERADRAAEALSRSTGIAGVSRAQLLRSAIESGLDVLESRHSSHDTRKRGS